MNLYKHTKILAALEEYVHQQNALLPDEITLSNVTFSEGFHQRMRQLASRRKHGFYVLFGTIGRRVASIVIAVLVATTVTTISVEALRKPVFQFFAEVYEKFTQVFFVDDEPNAPIAEMEKRMPTYIPERYAMESELNLGFLYSVVYLNGNGDKLRYTQHFKEHMEVQIDTEDIQYTTIMIGNQQGVTYRNKGFFYIVFSDDKYTYTLSGNISMDELQKIAESLAS